MKDLLLDLLYPKRCLGCKTFGSYICPSCKATIRPRSAQICPECTRQAIDGETHPGCQKKTTLEGLLSVYPYNGIIRTGLRRYKYGARLTDLTRTLISIISKDLKRNRTFSHFLQVQPIVIPVPSHWVRKLIRGFNHAELLGREFASVNHLPFLVNILQRVRFTKPQYGLTKEEREHNMEHAFHLNPQYRAAIKTYPAVLLFDDVWTTGSTMRACARVLKRAGAKSVWALTVAH